MSLPKQTTGTDTGTDTGEPVGEPTIGKAERGDTSISVFDLSGRIGEELGRSDWLLIDQQMVDAFADVSGDHQWIHVAPERAAATPFGGTIAHGFLVLSLLSRFRAEAIPPFTDAVMGINYGFDKLRFTAPVKTGARVRGRFALAAFDQRDAQTVQLTWDGTVDIENFDKPALVATWLTRIIISAT